AAPDVARAIAVVHVGPGPRILIIAVPAERVIAVAAVRIAGPVAAIITAIGIAVTIAAVATVPRAIADADRDAAAGTITVPITIRITVHVVGTTAKDKAW